MKFKHGAASFYIVAFSTLILAIVAASFATVIISAVTRSSNDDLSQSAYDAALAGVEDAKLAYSNYRRCVEKGATGANLTDSATISCEDIVYLMKNPNCDMVGLMVGRIDKQDWRDGKVGEVMVSDTSASLDGGTTTSDLNQAYTCVKINTTVGDYKANLSSSAQVKMVKIEFEGDVVQDLGSVELDWYDIKEKESLNYGNFDGSRVAFTPAFQTTTSLPPTVALQLVQTSTSFNLNDFWRTESGRTDRATMYFVPTGNLGAARGSGDTYTGIATGDPARPNQLSAAQVVKTNDQYIKNLPFLTYCPGATNTGAFACQVRIELPEPIGGARANDTFMLLVSLPYGEPDTNFSLTFYKKSDGSQVQMKGVQVEIDSTGRANDLYRRVEVRLETTDTSFAYPYYTLEMLGTGSGGTSIEKKMTINYEDPYAKAAPMD